MRIAAAQARPYWLDPSATTKKVIAWLENAAAQQVELVAFPETFLSGYPSWLEHTGGARFDDAMQKRAYAAYLDAAVEVTGPEILLVTEAARDLGIFVYLGTIERDVTVGRGTVFCTLVAIDPHAGVVGAHRKLMPTYEERLVWGIGDGNGLRVHQAGAARVGGLNCWENWMPQARHALYALGEELHVERVAGQPAEHRRHHPVHRAGGASVLPGRQRPARAGGHPGGLPAPCGAGGGRGRRVLPRWLRAGRARRQLAGGATG